MIKGNYLLESMNNYQVRNHNFSNLRRGKTQSNFKNQNYKNDKKSPIKRKKSQNDINSNSKEKPYKIYVNNNMNNEKNTKQQNILYDSYQFDKNNRTNCRSRYMSVPHSQKQIEKYKINSSKKRKLGYSKTNKLLNSYNNRNYFNPQITNNKIEKENKKEKPIYNNIKTCIYDDISDEEDLWCEDCINEFLAKERKKLKEVEKNKENNYNNYFEDKNKYFISDVLNDRLNKREQKINLAYENLKKLNQNGNSKEKLIKKNENSINSIGQPNNDYTYERFRTKYNQKQKIMQEYFNKYRFKPVRDDIAEYYSNYVDNPNCIPLKFGEYEPKKVDVANYQHFLDEQIKYKNSKKKKEKEVDIRMEKLFLSKEEEKYQEEKNQRMLKEKKIKEDLWKVNLELVKAKKARKNNSIKNIIEYDLEYNIDTKNNNKPTNNENKIKEMKIINENESIKMSQNLKGNGKRFKSFICDIGRQKEKMNICKDCSKILPKKSHSAYIKSKLII